MEEVPNSTNICPTNTIQGLKLGMFYVRPSNDTFDKHEKLP